MKVRDLMTSSNLVTARESDDLALASQMMLWADIRHLPVVRDGKVVGMLSERDLLAARADSIPGGRRTVGELMQRTVSVAGLEDELGTAISRMLDRKVDCLPVVDQGRLAGILTSTDILAHDARRPMPIAGAAGSLTIAEVMKREPATVRPQEWLLDAIALMVALDVRHLPVVDEAGAVVGMLSDRDVRSRVGAPWVALDYPEVRAQLSGLRVAAAMTAPAVTVAVQASLAEALQKLIDYRIGAVVAVDAENRPEGILYYVDAFAC